MTAKPKVLQKTRSKSITKSSSFTSKPIKDLQLIFGIHPIIELLRAGRRKLYTIYTTKPTPKAWNTIQPLLNSFTEIKFVAKEVLNKLADTNDHQSFVGFAGPQIVRKSFFDPQKASFLVMLSEIQDPRNTGAILRSAYCTGADGIILTEKNSSSINAVSIKSSAGLSEHLEIYHTPNTATGIADLIRAGYKIYFAALGGENALKVNYQGPVCIVIGNEATGINKNLLKYGQVVTLPQKEAEISYNASVAAGILFFTVSQKLNKFS